MAPVPTSSPEVQRALEILAVVCCCRFPSDQSDSVGSESEDDDDADKCISPLMVHPFKRVTGEDCQVEIKISPHGLLNELSNGSDLTIQRKRRTSYRNIAKNDDHSAALIAVIRDVTERYRRFEAEKRAHSETMQRQRDAQAVNRFTRHEVKNGLLAGIELCDSMRSSFEAIEKCLQRQKKVDKEALENADKSRRIMQEMDNMLHEVLDTVLAEAMARDVIHEVYQPRVEALDVKGLLISSNTGIGTSDRFPLELTGDMPYLLLDPQLLRYIHRNAFSNACKYGKADGKVLTIVEYDEARRMLEMKVINEPGKGHQECKYDELWLVLG